MFVTHPATTSKGPEWWTFLEGHEDFSLSVSEVSPEDSQAKALALLAEHGWRPEMGAEIGVLLIQQYERGRLEDVEARDPIKRSQKPAVILVAKHRDGYLDACIEGDTFRWEFGRTIEDAVTKLRARFPHLKHALIRFDQD